MLMKPWSRMRIGAPLASSMAKPRKICCTLRVTTNGAMPVLVTMTPLSMPTIEHRMMEPAMAAQIGQPRLPIT